MDKSAIEQLQKCEIVKQAQTVLDKAALNSSALALPSDFKIHNLEQFMITRASYRGQLKTNGINDYIKYVSDHDREGARCFVDSSAMQSTTILNLGTESTPGHANFSAILSLKRTAEFKSIIEICGKVQLTQKELAEFLEDWNICIQCFDSDDEKIDIKKAINAVRCVEIEEMRNVNHEIHDFKSKRSALETVAANTLSKPPSLISFSCVPYEGLKKRSFMVRISMLTGDDIPRFKLRIVALETEEEQMGVEFSELLIAGFDKLKVKTYLGVFTT